MQTYAEMAAQFMDAYEEGFAGDWWNDCVYCQGYDAETTEALDNNASEIAVYADGSYIVFTGEQWDWYQAAVGEVIYRTREGRHAAWDGKRWILDAEEEVEE